MTPSEKWPKPWMLGLHEQAVKDGFIWIEGISESDYESLKSRLYRIRRRASTSMAAFIKPEYHLVMVGKWEPANGGRFPMIYNKLADGRELPTVRAASGDEIAAYQEPKLVEPPPVNIGPEQLHIGEQEISGLVAGLRKSARERGQPSD